MAGAVHATHMDGLRIVSQYDNPETALHHLQTQLRVNEVEGRCITLYENILKGEHIPDLPQLVRSNSSTLGIDWTIPIQRGVSEAVTQTLDISEHEREAIIHAMLTQGPFVVQAKDESDRDFAERAFQVAWDRQRPHEPEASPPGPEPSPATASSASVTRPSFPARDHVVTGYIRDVKPAGDVKIYLDGLDRSIIHPDRIQERWPGINETAIYIGGPMSGTAPHIEDFEAPSINILPSGMKVWGAVSPHEYMKLMKAFKKHFRIKSKGCRFFHKPGLWFDPKLLKEWDIQVIYFVQRAGDMVLVNGRVLHWVCNVDLAYAQAINWFPLSECARAELPYCRGHKTGRKKRTDPLYRHLFTKDVSPIESTRTIYRCSECGVKPFSCKEMFTRHMASHGHKTIRCRQKGCPMMFLNRSSMNSHHSKRHRDGLKLVLCPVEGCGLSLTKHNLQAHLKLHNGGGMKICQFCHAAKSSSNMSKHEKICNANPAVLGSSVL